MAATAEMAATAAPASGYYEGYYEDSGLRGLVLFGIRITGWLIVRFMWLIIRVRLSPRLVHDRQRGRGGLHGEGTLGLRG